jgi:serine/threonine protein kinase
MSDHLLNKKERRLKKKKKRDEALKEKKPGPIEPPAHDYSPEEIAEAKANELEALQAIYMEDLKVVNDGEDGQPAKVEFTVKPSMSAAECHVAVKLLLTYTERYPCTTPLIEVENISELSDEEGNRQKLGGCLSDNKLKELQRLLDEWAKQNVGEVMGTELMEEALEYLRKHNHPELSIFEEMEVRQMEAEAGAEADRLKQIEEKQKRREAEAANFERNIYSEMQKKRAVHEEAEAEEEEEEENADEDDDSEDDDTDDDDTDDELEALSLGDNAQGEFSRYKGDFRELGKLGKGGCGEVVKARNRLDKRLYAVKKVKFDLNEEGNEGTQKLLREVTTISRLQHPHITRYYQAWVEGSGRQQQEGHASRNDGDDGGMEGGMEESEDEHDPFFASATSLSQKSGRAGDLEMDEEDEGEDEWGDMPEYQYSGDEGSTEGSTISGSDVDSDKGPAIDSEEEEGEEDDDDDESMGDSDSEATGVGSSGQERILYIQMEYCGGNTLRSIIEGGLHANVDEIWRLFRQIVEAVAYIHDRKMIHRDLKPPNIFLDSSSSKANIKLGDFGLATKRRDKGEGSGGSRGGFDPASRLNTAMVVARGEENGTRMRSASNPEPYHGDDSGGSGGSGGSKNERPSLELKAEKAPAADENPTPSAKTIIVLPAMLPHSPSFNGLPGPHSPSLYGLPGPCEQAMELLSDSITAGVGTAFYRAPEQEREDQHYDQKADIFSLGVILFEMFSPPFGTLMERAEALTKLRQKGGCELSDLFKSTTPDNVPDLVRRLCSPVPEIRPSAKELLTTDNYLPPKKLQNVDMQQALRELTNRESSTNNTLSLYPRLIRRLFAPSNMLELGHVDRYVFELDPLKPPRDFKQQLAAEMLTPNAELRLQMHTQQGLRRVFCRHGAMLHHSRLLKPTAKQRHHHQQHHHHVEGSGGMGVATTNALGAEATRVKVPTGHHQLGQYQMLEGSGLLVDLPYDLTESFARHIGGVLSFWDECLSKGDSGGNVDQQRSRAFSIGEPNSQPSTPSGHIQTLHGSGRERADGEAFGMGVHDPCVLKRFQFGQIFRASSYEGVHPTQREVAYFHSVWNKGGVHGSHHHSHVQPLAPWKNAHVHGRTQSGMAMVMAAQSAALAKTEAGAVMETEVLVLVAEVMAELELVRANEASRISGNPGHGQTGAGPKRRFRRDQDIATPKQAREDGRVVSLAPYLVRVGHAGLSAAVLDLCEVPKDPHLRRMVGQLISVCCAADARGEDVNWRLIDEELDNLATPAGARLPAESIRRLRPFVMLPQTVRSARRYVQQQQKQQQKQQQQQQQPNSSTATDAGSATSASGSGSGGVVPPMDILDDLNELGSPSAPSAPAAASAATSNAKSAEPSLRCQPQQAVVALMHTLQHFEFSERQRKVASWHESWSKGKTSKQAKKQTRREEKHARQAQAALGRAIGAAREGASAVHALMQQLAHARIIRPCGPGRKTSSSTSHAWQKATEDGEGPGSAGQDGGRSGQQMPKSPRRAETPSKKTGGERASSSVSSFVSPISPRSPPASPRHRPSAAASAMEIPTLKLPGAGMHEADDQMEEGGEEDQHTRAADLLAEESEQLRHSHLPGVGGASKPRREGVGEGMIVPELLMVDLGLGMDTTTLSSTYYADGLRFQVMLQPLADTNRKRATGKTTKTAHRSTKGFPKSKKDRDHHRNRNHHHSKRKVPPLLAISQRLGIDSPALLWMRESVAEGGRFDSLLARCKAEMDMATDMTRHEEEDDHFAHLHPGVEAMGAMGRGMGLGTRDASDVGAVGVSFSVAKISQLLRDRQVLVAKQVAARGKEADEKEMRTNDWVPRRMKVAAGPVSRGCASPLMTPGGSSRQNSNYHHHCEGVMDVLVCSDEMEADAEADAEEEAEVEAAEAEMAVASAAADTATAAAAVTPATGAGGTRAGTRTPAQLGQGWDPATVAAEGWTNLRAQLVGHQRRAGADAARPVRGRGAAQRLSIRKAVAQLLWQQSIHADFVHADAPMLKNEDAHMSHTHWAHEGNLQCLERYCSYHAIPCMVIVGKSGLLPVTGPPTVVLRFVSSSRPDIVVPLRGIADRLIHYRSGALGVGSPSPSFSAAKMATLPPPLSLPQSATNAQQAADTASKRLLRRVSTSAIEDASLSDSDPLTPEHPDAATGAGAGSMPIVWVSRSKHRGDAQRRQQYMREERDLLRQLKLLNTGLLGSDSGHSQAPEAQKMIVIAVKLGYRQMRSVNSAYDSLLGDEDGGLPRNGAVADEIVSLALQLSSDRRRQKGSADVKDTKKHMELLADELLRHGGSPGPTALLYSLVDLKVDVAYL